MEFCRCDAESVEIVLKGIWVTSEVKSKAGVFMTQYAESTDSTDCLSLKKVALLELAITLAIL